MGAVRGPRIGLIAAVMALALAAGLGAGYLWLGTGQREPAVSGTPAIGGDFTLTDQTGAQRTAADFRGQYMLVFFGFTHCPDFCPTSLQVMAEAVDALGAEGEKVVPVFITVDPARDTVPVLKDYVELFHPRMVGLTGTDGEVAQAAKAYRVYYAKAGEGEDYLMDHSSFTYLMGPNGTYLAHFSYGTPPDKMADRIRSFL